PAFVDYKDVQGLKKMCTSQGKLFSRKRSGNCATFQRAVKDAIKRARFMALMPYVGE
ncbi:MAG TPA: 30S ribosomal protein S18, partial [Gemmataceae bacterium]|nr:30S ribosomal protein S18 [Gemmataceae bacterium]